MDLTELKGVGAKKIQALQEAGLDSLEAVAEIDLRKNIEVPGFSKQKLQDCKRQARARLRKQGRSFATAPYARQEIKPRRKGTANGSPPKKRGLLGRLLRK